jgi:HlyD family secretion protein
VLVARSPSFSYIEDLEEAGPKPIIFMKEHASGAELAEIITQARSAHPLRKWLIVLLVIALFAGGFWYYVSHNEEQAGPIFVTEELTRGDLSLIVTATGNLAPTNQVTVGSELSGTISEVLVDTNDTVEKGQIIAKLDTTKLAQQTARTRAILLAAKARVNQVSATVFETSAVLERFRELDKLSGGKTPSRADMDTAVAAAQRAQADLESAKASVSQSEADVKSFEQDLFVAVIRSPVNGIVLTRSVEVGQTVAASFTAPILFLIAEDLRKMDLVVTVAEADIGRLEKGQLATFSVDAWPTRTYHAEVKRVSFGSVVTNNVVTYSAELSVANDDLSLRPGMTATADIAVAKSTQVLLVPNAALRFDPANSRELGKTSDEPKKTLVQKLSSRSRYRSGPPAIKLSPRSQEPRVWKLVDNQPVEIFVKIGLTDGRYTEASSESLTEGTPLIISAKPVEAE